MNRKILHIFLVLVFLIASMSISVKHASAAQTCPNWFGCPTTCTTGQDCWYKDAASTQSKGASGTHAWQYCSADANTVAGSPTTIVSGTYGGVNNELRWSAYCVTNWTRGKVAATANGTYQMGLRASPSNSGNYMAFYWTSVTVGYQKYTLMVDGNSTVTANTGLYNTTCLGKKDSKGNYTGFGGTPNCTNLYSPLASASG
jgi:hypothetical protein